MPKTTEFHPGKYEGNRSQWLARIVHNVSMDGCDEEFGDVCEYGLWAGRVCGKRYNFYITEDSQGFVTVEYARQNTWDDAHALMLYREDERSFDNWMMNTQHWEEESNV